ncbi:hypothetical protein [Prochlorothrix hollandica]|uniref:Uncharacterized protein n=1 Tax=Prochlorothrix hollandica PCC 9006 = CALU 1027 TaxID=317619 RepID=A0A0M2PZ59_PROHO|nr:hypothetical protein [Prochlorothrix hollandica]KKI99681.1 hypothetical protein PROH_07250 [Prochlorothrix hollandica PCC 9006 = CALU 1027]
MVETRYLSLTLPLGSTAAAVLATVEQAIAPQGEILRWAITAVDPSRQTLAVEAVITPALPPTDSPDSALTPVP